MAWVIALGFTLLGQLVGSGECHAGEPVQDGQVSAEPASGQMAWESDRIPGGLEYLVPELEASPYRIAPGRRSFLGKVGFSPSYGSLGGESLYSIRLAYNPNTWLGYEASLGHNPGTAVHAALYMVNGIVRYPLPSRLQPYLTVGYGMMMVFPGRLINADPVTKNAFAAGAGLELYIREDLAIRGELRRLVVPGGETFSNETILYNYGEATVGLSFYRSLGDRTTARPKPQKP